jgi:hypothetical protein
VTRGAQIAVAVLGVLTLLALAVVIGGGGDPGEDPFYWRDTTGAGRAESVALADNTACERRKPRPHYDGTAAAEQAIRNWDDAFAGCMQARGWRVWDRENTGAANAGRFAILVFVLPVLLLSLAAILLTRGGYRLWVLRGLTALGGFVAIYLGWGLLNWLLWYR